MMDVAVAKGRLSHLPMLEEEYTSRRGGLTIGVPHDQPARPRRGAGDLEVLC